MEMTKEVWLEWRKRGDEHVCGAFDAHAKKGDFVIAVAGNCESIHVLEMCDDHWDFEIHRGKQVIE